ncbi:MAG TPA: hypothetical protein VNG12_07265 [Acidimicrobiales bacterium]|nr:hypothetical protein [Acidimicrobiales bacterium]
MVARSGDPARGRFFCNAPRKVALFAGLAAVLVLLIGAGFANMSSTSAPTALETAVVRWTIVGCLAVGAVAYLIGGRMLRNDGE